MKALQAYVKFLVIAVALCQTTGCTSVAPRLDSDFGKSLNTLKAYQTINPRASANTANPGMDGRAAKDAMDRYYKSFAVPTPNQTVFTIGTGSSTH